MLYNLHFNIIIRKNGLVVGVIGNLSYCKGSNVLPGLNRGLELGQVYLWLRLQHFLNVNGLLWQGILFRIYFNLSFGQNLFFHYDRILMILKLT